MKKFILKNNVKQTEKEKSWNGSVESFDYISCHRKWKNSIVNFKHIESKIASRWKTGTRKRANSTGKLKLSWQKIIRLSYLSEIIFHDSLDSLVMNWIRWYHRFLRTRCFQAAPPDPQLIQIYCSSFFPATPSRQSLSCSRWTLAVR